MKNAIITAAGVIGSAIASIYGGWTMALTTLSIFMGIDLVTGIIVAGVFHKSPKTSTGTLESRTGAKGLCRKVMVYLLVLIAHRLDLAMGTTYIQDAVCIAFITNEAISIIENAGLMGLPVPRVIINAIYVLKKNNKDENETEEE
jgi:toxin secretion/phage lysis holin